MNAAETWYAVVRHSPLAILADLDGTLIPFAPTPSEARPQAELVALLGELVALPGLYVAVVSGRPRDELDSFFGRIEGLSLVAEHGAWMRATGAWQALEIGDPAALGELAEELGRIASHHRGALIERKTVSVCLHMRRVAPYDKAALLVQATAAVESWLAAHPGHERLDAAEALEIRSARARKALAVPSVRERAGPEARLVALGDDLTDEDMFAALGPGDEAILVGAETSRRTVARWRLGRVEDAVAFLGWVRDARREAATPPPPVLPRRVAPPRPIKEGGHPRRAAFRLLAISNRLPNLRTPTSPDEERTRNVGGLVSALEPVLVGRGGVWLGWSGRTLPDDGPSLTGVDESTEPPLAWIDLPQSWHDRYYNGFCNRCLWPLFHTFPERVRFEDVEWDAYVRANEAFAAAATELVEPDAPVWVHDYHLLLLGACLQRLGHRGPVGLFLHTPFPALDVFSMLPWAEKLLDEMLAFDLIGFHTKGYVDNFRHCVGALSPAAVGDDVIEHRGRRIRVRAFPIGIVPGGFQETPDTEAAEEDRVLMRAIAPARLVLGVDRLDYTKGIPERLLAFARLLDIEPSWRRRVSLVQVSVPSRADVPEYTEQRARIESVVGRVNGEYGEADWTPVRYLYRSYGRAQLAALYRAAAVGYVTPLRDGMNLVAKEFVAAQNPADPGVLLLSRFAGAAVELHHALITNPYHVDGLARDLDRALRMPLDERRARHEKLLAVVSRTTAVSWAEDFLSALDACASSGSMHHPAENAR